MFESFYKDKKVFVTGHTGFKGSWLVSWLLELGADIVGYALEPPTHPNHYSLLDLNIQSIIGDIRDADRLHEAVYSYRPEIVFHLAAQSLVRQSYQKPAETFATNVMGTVNLFDSCRLTDSVKAVVNITSDKCYENREWVWPYRERDPLGGHDPYSASKGCAELVTASYRKSYFSLEQYNKSHQSLIASVRAGNVIGGGDWGEDRLVPDIMRAAACREKVVIRNPHAIRPWQHVLEPLTGYLMLAKKLAEGNVEFSGAWNFGPNEESHTSVLHVVEELRKGWNEIDCLIESDQEKPHEASLLKLDCSKARSQLGWRPIWDRSKTFLETVAWYREYYNSGRCLSMSQMEEYVKDAEQKQVAWAS
jgi:CDP-glucose 4,6-dehydratase